MKKITFLFALILLVTFLTCSCKPIDNKYSGDLTSSSFVNSNDDNQGEDITQGEVDNDHMVIVDAFNGDIYKSSLTSHLSYPKNIYKDIK